MAANSNRPENLRHAGRFSDRLRTRSAEPEQHRIHSGNGEIPVIVDAGVGTPRTVALPMSWAAEAVLLIREWRWRRIR